jgi:hypothetical protein
MLTIADSKITIDLSHPDGRELGELVLQALSWGVPISEEEKQLLETLREAIEREKG